MGLNATGRIPFPLLYEMYYKDGEDKAPHQLVITKASKLKLLDSVAATFEGKVGQKLVERIIENSLCQFAKYPLPQELVDKYVEEIITSILAHYQLNAEALVPLYNISIEFNTEIILANSILCTGSSDSLYAQKLSHSKVEKYISVSKDNHFLRISVSGDEENRARQVESEVEKSLSVLRFITMWRSRIEGAKYVIYNPARVVNIREDGERFILYHKPEEPEKGLPIVVVSNVFLLSRNAILTFPIRFTD